MEARRLLNMTTAGILVVAAIASTAMGKPVVFSIPETQGSSGSEVQIPIKVSGAKGMCGGQLEVHYDPRVLEAKKVEPGSLLEDGNTMVDCNPKEPGRLRIAFVGLDEINGDGELIRAVFAVKGNAGQSSLLELKSVEAGQLKNMLELQAIAQNGRFTVAGSGFSLLVILLLLIAAVLVAASVVRVALRRRGRSPAS
jgi:hypothetical protein